MQVNSGIKAQLDIPTGMVGAIRFVPTVQYMRVPHRHDELELNLVTSGKASYLLNGRRYDLRRNTLVWLFPGQDHILLDRNESLGYWLGVFTPEMIASVCTSPGTKRLLDLDPPGYFCRQLGEPNAVKLLRLFEQVAEMSDRASINAGLGFCVMAAWEAFCRSDDIPAGSSVHSSVESAARILRDEIETVNIALLAERVGVSAPYLSALFKRQTGMSLAQFRNKQRITRFLDFYGEGKRFTILEAAMEAGFGSYQQFFRVFVEMMGCSPAEYKRSL